MLADKRQIKALNIVVVGDFNPVIINPSWLAAKRMIREAEGSQAKIDVIHNDLVKFSLDWAQIQVTRDRFAVKTSQEPFFEPVRDLTISIFTRLSETPIRAVGVNHLWHYALDDETKYRELGNRIAPLSNWSAVLNDPAILSLEILQDKKGGKVEGAIRIRIQPSDTIRTQYAFMVNINDHYKVSNIDMTKILVENWKSSFELASRVEDTIDKILK